MNSGEIGVLAPVLVDAFMRESFCTWAFPDATQRKEALTAMFAEHLASLPPNAVVDAVGDEPRACAIWLPPGSEMFDPPGPNTPGHVAAALSRLAQAAPRESFTYLEFLAARTPGTGAGSDLVRHHLVQADNTAQPTALWTGSNANLAFYARLGYRQISELDLGARRHGGSGEIRSRHDPPKPKHRTIQRPHG